MNKDAEVGGSAPVGGGADTGIGPGAPPGAGGSEVTGAPEARAAPTPLLRVERVSMRFGTVVALEDVSLDVRAGAVTCLLGDNGAGKSTLISILSGVVRPTAGRILLGGAPARFESPRHARARGIATVYQDLAVIPLMSVWRNFVLGAEPAHGRGPFARLDARRARNQAREGLARMGIELRDVDRPVGTLSGGERQSLAIARAVYFGARLLILDEPTAALGVKQAGVVLRDVARARERGVGVVFVTHNPRHAREVGDRFVVLLRGRVAGDFDASMASVERLAGLMSGVEPVPAG